jgi:DNA-binding PadR family transcriptional regulator
MDEDSIYDRPPEQAELDFILRKLVLKGYAELRMIDGQAHYRVTDHGREALELGREQFYKDNPDIP